MTESIDGACPECNETKSYDVFVSEFTIYQVCACCNTQYYFDANKITLNEEESIEQGVQRTHTSR